MKLFLSILSFFPYALAAVQAVEASVPAGTPGVSKKQIILDSISSVVQIGEQVPVPAIATVSVLIDSIVKALNTYGVFSHKPAAAAPAAPVHT